MKHILLLLMAVAIGINSFAQVEKNYTILCGRGTISYMEPIQTSQSTAQKVASVIGTVLEAATGSASLKDQHPEFVNSLSASIAGGVSASHRVDVIDGFFTAQELQSDIPAIYYDGTISSLATESRIQTKKDDKGKSYTEKEYCAHISATISFKDAHTDVILYTMHLNESSYTARWLASPEKALAHLVNEIGADVTKCMNSLYPLYASVIEGNVIKKNKQKSVYIDLGYNFGMASGCRFKVFVKTTIAGKEASKEIGNIRVKEVLGDEISLCNVTKGAASIKQALESGLNLVITSID